MTKRVVILGASLGGLVAAAELRSRGHDVTIVERGQSVGGLYSKTSTPFGYQEIGMHVLYVDTNHFSHLSSIFGKDAFRILRDHKVDEGASANFGDIYFDSHYPSLLNHPLREKVLDEIISRSSSSNKPANAMEAASDRFGQTAANKIIAPILRKLWLKDATLLSPHALHCFFDLRRLVLTDKATADYLKDSPSLDEVIANPLQSEPKGRVFGGRMGLTFRTEISDLDERVSNWAKKTGVTIRYGEDVSCDEGELLICGEGVSDNYDACIIAIPIHLLADRLNEEVDRLELSINYFELTTYIEDNFPSYYVLVHESAFSASRIVNYDAYHPEHSRDRPSVIAVESIHSKGKRPTEEQLIQELRVMLPSLQVKQGYPLPRGISLYAPTLHNAKILEEFQQKISRRFGATPLYFSGMRTDTGVFFSHHTIGLAYDSALACHEKLAAY